MGLEQKLTELLSRQGEVVDFALNKASEWDQRVANKEAQVDAYLDSAHATELLPKNMLADPFYFTDFSTVAGVESSDGAGSGDKLIPTSGFKLMSGSQSVIELVSPMHFGLEAVRNDQPNANDMAQTNDAWLASPTLPLVSLGAKIKEGGLRGRYFNSVTQTWKFNANWGSSKQTGRITKVTCPAVAINADNVISLTVDADPIHAITDKFLIRFWAYVKKGGLAVGNHAGHKTVQGSVVLTEADCAKGTADHPYQLIEIENVGSYSGNSAYRHVCLSPLFGVENEIYIGPIYLCPLRGTKNVR